MVQAVIYIDEHINRILNVVKAKYGLKDKSEAISLVVREYGDDILEPELRPEYVAKLKKIEREGKSKTYKNFAEFRKEIENA
ncbi:antitoxin [Candidatus Micrarchaeota archaeon CG08_land_8_20_14_0_20_49_17]|nr:MAG: antitoxin [Candidatus Micrarchaeota archaeon CG1_02_49_24]PIU09746.1 MAG: antitoxin [Candidatus Micrarchaeota archaeon CG08_land_8_20_14_0_20_49_17]PIU82411.1 MAG: antitoxin [Candidatus Micrarchaeota archaeon CG06_land_8_20_14_3_00_50_6]HII54036.1 DUF2683 family protein [Candidatus Micrarchaeota archaeon]